MSRQCAVEVRRVMHERALSVNLDPEIEAECISDLSQHCSELTAKSEVCSLLSLSITFHHYCCQRLLTTVMSNSSGSIGRATDL